MNITDFGEKICSYRQNQNMTQEEFAARMCVTPQAVSRWERNQSLPDTAMLADICRILNVSADYLLNVESGQMSENYDCMAWHQVMKILRSSSEPICLKFGGGLVQIFAKDYSWKKIVDRQRKRLALEGILLPAVRVMDQPYLKNNEIQILSYCKVLYNGTVGGITDKTCVQIMEKLADTVRKHYAHILNVQIIKTLTDNLKIAYPAQIEGIVPEKISYSLLLEVLKYFVSAGNSMVHLLKIIEYVERELRVQPQLTAVELAKGAAKYV